jgi:hypothetical protein
VQATLFGTLHPRATLHALSWRLSNTAAVILDDTIQVWRDCDQPLLLLIRRAPSQRELGGISSFQYLKLLADRYNGGDCSAERDGGAIRPDMRSQLDAASNRLLSVIDHRRSQFAPDEVSVLLQLSHIQWGKLLEQERLGQLETAHWRARCAAAQREADASKKRVVDLEAEAARLKRKRGGEPLVKEADP